MDAARNLARFAAGLKYDDLPKEVIDKVKELVLDQLGCELAGSTLPWGRANYRYVRDNKGSREESTVVNYGLRAPAQDAAFANASFGRSVEVDDIDPTSSSHLGSIIIPAAFAVGQKEMIGGREFMAAVVAGYEIASRIGAAACSAMKRGFHATTLFGPFGAATASGIILGLDEDGLLNALSIAASHASGLMEYSETGGSVNRLHAGIAAYGGIRASLLAQRGFTGPATFLEGRKGFLPAFSGEAFPEELSRGLGKEFKILGVGLRLYCCCGTQNCGLDGISKIATEHTFATKDIEEVTVRVPSSAFRLIGTIAEPKDMTSSQFSGRYGVALRLARGGNGFKEYFNEDNLRDQEILSLIGKMKYLLDTDLDKLGMNTNPTRVVVKLKDGAVYEEAVYTPKGSVQNPMTRKERLDKFKEFASLVLAKNKVDEIIKTISELDKLDNIWKLGTLLVAG